MLLAAAASMYFQGRENLLKSKHINAISLAPTLSQSGIYEHN